MVAGSVAADEAAQWPRTSSAGGWEEQGLPPRTGHGTAAEEVASADVAAQAAVGDVAADKALEKRMSGRRRCGRGQAKQS